MLGHFFLISICYIFYWSGARFSKVPKLFGPISCDRILFVSSKRRRLEARNFAAIFIFIPFTTYEKTRFTEYAGRNFTNGFSGPKTYRDFRETGPWPELLEACMVSANQRELPRKGIDFDTSKPMVSANHASIMQLAPVWTLTVFAFEWHICASFDSQTTECSSCIWNEIQHTDGYNYYQSDVYNQFYLGLKRKGVPKNGNKTALGQVGCAFLTESAPWNVSFTN